MFLTGVETRCLKTGFIKSVLFSKCLAWRHFFARQVLHMRRDYVSYGFLLETHGYVLLELETRDYVSYT